MLSLTYNLRVPILDQHTFDFFSRSPEQTRRIGVRLGQHLESGDLVCLQGDLGAGKTTLVQGMAQGWGSLDGATSPTFVLVNDRMLGGGSLVVEWPERVQSALPKQELRVIMEHVDEEQRRIQFVARGGRYDAVIDRLQREMFGAA